MILLDQILTEWNAITLINLKFQHFGRLFWILPIVLALILILVITFVKLDPRLKENKKYIHHRWVYRSFMFLTRLVIFALIIFAFAEPYGEVTKDIPGDTSLTILVDNSTSMELYDLSFIPILKNLIEQEIPVKLRTIATGLDSKIGEGVLANVEQNKNLLVISDGQITEGLSLGGISLLASNLNSTISMIELASDKQDFGVEVFGPSKTIAEVNNQYKVRINRFGESQAHKVKLVVEVDGEQIIDTLTDKSIVEFTRNFTEGTHKIEAKLALSSGGDYFPQNNKFFKTTTVIEKPKVLLVTKEDTALATILDELYELTITNSIPDKAGLEPYYAVVLNDLPLESINNFEPLQEYVIEGNGLVVVGGYNSFDNGFYKDSIFETLLPINIGTAKKKPGGANVVLVIDISGSTGFGFGSADKSVDVEKAMAIGVINDINENNRVGAVAFNDKAYKVADIDPLFVNKADLIDKISRLKDGGPTVLNSGLRGAYELLNGKTGSRNIIWITDGVTLDTIDLMTTEEIIKSMNNDGIRVYIVGVGKNANEDFLSKVGKYGGGFYLRASDATNLKILFGEPEKKDVGQAFQLFILDPSHFITDGLETDAVLYGYNQVVPKTSADLLVTSDSGEPAITTWRYGVGRVGTVTVFAGGNNLGELLTAPNSRLLTRTMNWAIGEPERKEPYFVDVSDSRVNRSTKVIVKSDKFPKAEGFEFSKIDNNKYQSTFVKNNLGFDSILDHVFGVNYDYEYQKLGMNSGLTNSIIATRGKIFKVDEVDEIINHVKTVSKRTVTKRTTLALPFLAFALLLFICEAIFRRLYESWIMR